MSSVAISLIVFGCTFGGALLGLFLRAVLPEHHLTDETRDVVKLGMGLVGTMSALLLGLLVASAKNLYDNAATDLTQMSAKVVFLDRLLANYGDQTKEARATLRQALTRAIDRIWPSDSSQSAQLDPSAAGAEVLYHQLYDLKPETDMQRELKERALGAATDVGQLRWLLFEQSTPDTSTPFLIVIVFWLTIIFISFGLFAPLNGTVVATLFLCALSVCGAFFMILELTHPFDGLIRISSSALSSALAHLGS